MTWRVAKSLEALLSQVNDAAPRRSKSSDGGIGDAAHASRSSDHNPWVKDSKGVGVVTARDFTHDPANGCDCESLAQSLVASKDARIKYIIWNRRIILPPTWGWRAYSGSNPHTHHAHVSVREVPSLYDSDAPWSLALPAPAGEQPLELSLPVLQQGSEGPYVERAQRLLGVKADGSFGPKTALAVRNFQRKHGLVADGVIGTYTWAKLIH